MSAEPSATQRRASGTTAPLMLVVGETATARAAAAKLEPSGVRTISASSGHDALARFTDLAPDLVLVGSDEISDTGGSQAVRQIRDASEKRPLLVVLGDAGEPGATSGPREPDADYLPADVGLADLVEYLRSRLSRATRSVTAPPKTPSRPELSAHQMSETVAREWRRGRRTGRPGVLAAVSVGERPQLRERFGPEAEKAISAAFDHLFALDGSPLEQHSVLSADGFLLLMPETDLKTAKGRIQKLSDRIADLPLEVSGEHLRLTPVIGFASFGSAESGEELCEQATVARGDACLHLDLIPVEFSPSLVPPPVPDIPVRDRMLALAERLRVPLQVVFTGTVLLSLPFIVYILAWYAGFDLTTVTYPLMAAALTFSAAALWIESFRAVPSVKLPPESDVAPPTATAIIAAYLPNEAATIVDTITNHLGQNYPGGLQVILAYNSPQHLPVEEALAEMASQDDRLLLLRVDGSTSKAQNINAALAHVRGEFVGVFDADHHPAPGSFSRAWRWLASGHDIVQGHCVVRNGDASWVARMVAIEFETVYAVSHPGRARLHGFGIFGGSNGYWRRDALRRIRMQRSMLTEDIDSSMRSLREGYSIVSDPGLISSELAPTTLGAFWNQRMRWAQGWTQTSMRHLRPMLNSDKLSVRQKLGAGFMLGWAQALPWITIQVIPILAFFAWRDGGFGNINWLVPLLFAASVFTFSVGVAQAIFAYGLGDESIRRRRSWFFIYACHSILWFGEFKNLIVRVAQLKELTGEREWRVTPRAVTTTKKVGGPMSRSKAPGRSEGTRPSDPVPTARREVGL